jgi:hypothetical protein
MKGGAARGDKKLARELFVELNHAAIGILEDMEPWLIWSPTRKPTKAWLRALLMTLLMAPPPVRKTQRAGPLEVKVPI